MHKSLAVLFMFCLGELHAANTIQDFTAVFPNADVVPKLSATPTVEIIDGWDGNALRLTESIGGQNAGAAFNQTYFGDWQEIFIKFEMQFSPSDGADGIGFALANSETFGADNRSPVPSFTENVNLQGSFGVGFDIHNNLDVEGENSVSLHWDGNTVISTPIDDLNLSSFETGNVIEALIQVTPVANGSNVNVVISDLDLGISERIYTDTFVAGLFPYAGRPAFRARTGGLSSEQSIDNLVVNYTPAGNGDIITFGENFESFPTGPIILETDVVELVGGTPFAISNPGTDPGPTIMNDGPTGGRQPGHLQLSSEATGQHNFIAFDNTSEESSNIKASFDFRMLDLNGNHADGMSFVLAPTDLYNDTGPLTSDEGEWNPAEEPHLTGAFGLGFDTFNNDFGDDFEGCPTEGDTDLPCEEPGNSDRRANHISLHWDGVANGDHVAMAIIPLDDFDLANGAWNQLDLQIDESENGMLVTLDVTDGSDGSVHRLFDQFLIEDASFDGPMRAAFGARTGGSSDFQSIDNVNISFGDGDPCDFDGDGVLGLGDVDLLAAEIKAASNNAAFDLNGDGSVNQTDLQFFVGDPSKLNTYMGDANLDGEFNTTDLVAIFQAGEYEDELTMNSTWATGDWNADGEFNTGDLVVAFQNGGFELGPRASAVPEPTGMCLCLLGAMLVSHSRLSLRRK